MGKINAEARGEKYFMDDERYRMDYSQRDSFTFRNEWKYMPSFRVLDKNDFMKTTAVFPFYRFTLGKVCRLLRM